MLKIGVLGAGHLGKIHLKCIGLATEHYQLVGFHDPNPQQAQEAAEAHNTKAFDSVEALLDAVDVVDIVTPTTTHYTLAKQAMLAGKHVFIEKPLTHTVEEAEELVTISQQQGVKVQVGHVERFNPALLALGDMPLDPMFIEAHRLAIFNPRGTDVSVILDLMIHDLDIVLSLVQSPVREVHASGVAVVSDSPDIANVRLEFEHGGVANLTASRISLKQMRKVRFFQRDAYISLDFLEKQAQIVRLYDQPQEEQPHMMELETNRGKKYITMDMPDIESVNAIKMELETFAESIMNNTRPRVGIEDGYSALKLAHQIIARIETQNSKILS
jgi:predicted dehydrogenase